MVTLRFDIPNQCIEVPAPEDTVFLQEVWDQSQEFLSSAAGMSIPTFIFGSGKVPLGGGKFTGIVVQLVDWQIKFDDRAGPTTEPMTVDGGDLVGFVGSLTGPTQFPVKPSSFTFVTVFQSTQPGLIDPGQAKITETHLSVSYDSNTSNLDMAIWLVREGGTVTTPTNCQIDWHTPNGTLVFSETSNSPNSDGIFLITRSETLTGTTSYYAKIFVTDSEGTVITTRGVPTQGT